MSSVYRILIDSSKRQSGHPFDFVFDVSRITTSRDFIGKSFMMAIEWCDSIKYSEHNDDFSASPYHPRVALLTCPSLKQHNTYESWTGDASSTLALLQSYKGTGFYGISADQPYISRNAYGCYIQGDRLNQAGTLSFKVLLDYGNSVETAEEPFADEIWGDDFTFSLVFWEVEKPIPERPISPYYDFYKLVLRSDNRISGTPGDCHIPLFFSSSGSMGVGKWQLAVEAVSLVMHEVVFDLQPKGIAIVSDSFRDSYGHRVIGFLPKSDGSEATFGWYGQKLTIKPVTRDTVGVNVQNSLDGLSTIHIGFRDIDKLVELTNPENIDEWTMILTFYRVE